MSVVVRMLFQGTEEYEWSVCFFAIKFSVWGFMSYEM